MVDVPEPGAAMGLGLKVTVSPVPSPEADKVIAALKPPEIVAVIVEVPELPLSTLIGEGEAERLKLGLDELPVSALRRLVPFGLPQPVAKS